MDGHSSTSATTSASGSASLWRGLASIGLVNSHALNPPDAPTEPAAVLRAVRRRIPDGSPAPMAYHDEGYVFCQADRRPYHPERFLT